MSENGEADDDRFDEIIADYLDGLSSGTQADEAALVQAHPEFADQLQQFFADHRRMGGLLEGASEDHDTLPPSGRTRGAGDAPTIINLDSNGSAAAKYDVDPDKCIADYLLEEKIAEGGMGVVYKAKQLSLNRTVAFKMIRAGEFADAEEIRRFRVEAEAAANLTHPGIVPIYQIGEDKGQHFFSMALIDGPSLSDMIKTQPMKPRRAAEYVSKVARAVHYAHEQGIIHRDIKPANVLVDSNNEPKVTDFGLAKQVTADHELTMSGQILGTASYMSPEQAAGREVTPLADVYSIGALLYALLTGQPPFTGASPVDILMDVLSKDPATPSSLNISLSRDIETICMRCLEKDTNRRYTSAAAVADDLDRFLDGTPILARPVGRLEKGFRWCQRRPAIATVIFLSVMLCFAAMAYYFKEGEIRNPFDSRTSAALQRRHLAELAHEYYASHPPVARSDRDRLFVLAGQAMLKYQMIPGPSRDRSSSETAKIARRAFEDLEDALLVSRNAAPENPELKSALADCCMQLVRFCPTSDGGAGVVSQADAPDVEHWLDTALTLLLELRDEFPNNAAIVSRAAAARSAMENLPGTPRERFEHLKAATAIGSPWAATSGMVQFSVEQPQPLETGATRIEQLEGTSTLSASESLRLAHAYCEDRNWLNAITELQDALASGELSSAQLQQAFTDLVILADHEPGAVALALKKYWPTNPEGFYNAMLGIRLGN